MRLAAFSLVVAISVAGCGESDAEPRVGDQGRQPLSVESGSWGEIRQAPFGLYTPEGAFWINGQLVVVAGSTVQAWDPRRDRWKVVAEIPQAEECEGCGYSEIAVWTGERLMLWGGGFSYRASDGSAHAGVSVDLEGNVTPLPDAPIRSRWWHTAVWTGGEMIVWGGGCGRHECGDGAAFDPDTNRWRKIAPGPMSGYAHSLVWTGKEMIVWGGSDDYEAEGWRGFPRSFLNIGAAYDPATDSWRELAPSGLDPRGWHSAAWTGKEMIVWGGVDADDAGAYDPVSDSWRRIPFGPLSGRVDHSAVWSGREMIVWGGSPPGGGFAYDDGAAFDPARNSWRMLPGGPVRGRYRHRALWSGEEMVLWGGQGSRRTLADGAVFRPSDP